MSQKRYSIAGHFLFLMKWSFMLARTIQFLGANFFLSLAIMLWVMIFSSFYSLKNIKIRSNNLLSFLWQQFPFSLQQHPFLSSVWLFVYRKSTVCWSHWVLLKTKSILLKIIFLLTCLTSNIKQNKWERNDTIKGGQVRDISTGRVRNFARHLWIRWN